MNAGRQDVTMSCQDAVELLPWLINGSLDEGEQRDLLDHLRACESCRRELDGTSRCWEIFSRHVPSLALAEYAQGLPPGELDREAIERHLALCPSCRQELEWMTAEKVVDFEAARAARLGRARPSRLGARPGWRRIAALAAGVVAALGLTAALRQLVEISFATPPWIRTAVTQRAPDSSRPSPAGAGRGAADAPAAVLFADGFEMGSTASWSQVHNQAGAAAEPRNGVNL